jgi:hypothetical protein
MFNSVKKVNISAANIRTNFQISKYFCGNLPRQIILANCKSAMGTGTWHILKTIKICTENKELFGFLCNIL